MNHTTVVEAVAAVDDPVLEDLSEQIADELQPSTRIR